MIKDFETERPPTTKIDTATLYADAMHLNRMVKRYKRLAREVVRQDVNAELSPFYDGIGESIAEAEQSLLRMRNAINDGVI